MFDDGAQPKGGCGAAVCAVINAVFNVFRREHGLAVHREGSLVFAPVILEALLGQRPVVIRLQSGDLLRIVFESDG